MKLHSLLLLFAFISIVSCNFESEKIASEQERLAYDLFMKAKHESGDASTSIGLLDRSIEIGEGLSSPTYLIYALNLRGYLYLHEQQYLQAMRDFSKAVEVNEENTDQLAYSYHHLGIVYTKIDDFEKSAMMLEKAQDLYRKTGQTAWLQRNHYHMAMASLFAKRVDFAEQHAKASMQLAEELGSEREIALSGSLLSRIYIEQSRITKAEELISQMEQRFGNTDVDTKLRFLGKKAYMAEQLGQTEVAVVHYQDALQILQNNSEVDERLVYNIHLFYGKLLSDTEKTAEAVRVWRAALDHPAAKPGMYAADLTSIYDKLATTIADAGDYEEGFKYAQLNATINTTQRELLSIVNDKQTELKNLLQKRQEQLAAAEATSQARFWYLLIALSAVLLLAVAGVILYRSRRYWLKEAKELEESYVSQRKNLRLMHFNIHKMQYLLKEIVGGNIEWINPEVEKVMKDMLTSDPGRKKK